MIQKKQIEEFEAGRYENGYGYQYFVPEFIDLEWTWIDGQLNQLIESASIRLGELNSFARLVPNISLFIHLHVVKEAVVSSRIEGTQTTMNEALLPFEEILPEKRDDWREVQNYTRALDKAIERLESVPLSTRLLRMSHGTLMEGVRGKNKSPGEFRKSQNWIGGASLADAAFIPPAHQYVPELMSDLEKFLHDRQVHVPSLIRIGLAHYQFETIHPFLDGNGRIGRLLITLFLISENILASPLLYLSSFFEENKMLYYDKLMRVREQNDLLGWLKYFLVGIEKTAAIAVEILRAIQILKADVEIEINRDLGKRSNSATTLLNSLFDDPVVTKSEVQTICKLSRGAANDLVNIFVERKFLKEMTGKQRNQIFYFEPYLKLFD